MAQPLTLASIFTHITHDNLIAWLFVRPVNRSTYFWSLTPSPPLRRPAPVGEHPMWACLTV